MGKTPGRNPNSKFQRRPVPAGRTPTAGTPPIHRAPGNGSAPEGRRSAHRANLNVAGKLKTLISGLVQKVLPRKAAAPGRRKQTAVQKRRFAVCAVSAAAVVAVVLLVLLAPDGSAASAPDETPSLSSALSSPTSTATAAGTPVPTTEPDETASSTPSATPKASPTPTATQKPSPTPTATRTAAPTVTPSPTPGSDINTLVAFYAEEAEAYYDKIGYSSNHYEYTGEELLMLARTIQKEAGSGSPNGMIAVGNVIMNRVLCGRFGSTIAAVVTAPNQFAYNESLVPAQSALVAARAVLDDEVWLVPQNTYFFKGSGTEGVAWGNHPYCTTIGGNYFYTHDYSGRYNGDSIPDALYARAYKYAQYGCKPSQRVYRIQYMLKSLGYGIEKADKYFGMGTRAALIKFQQDHGLATDGVAGPATMKALIRAFGVDAYCDKFS